MKTMKGITWNHTRGYVPMVATSQRYAELNPEIQIQWEKRSLQGFADDSIEKLAQDYDFLIIDHPHIGAMSETGAVLPLDEYLPSDFLHDQYINQIGHAHENYYYNGHQWALSIDAAAPVAAWREDKFAELGLKLPESWNELIALAKLGYVLLPAIPVDSLMNIYPLCLDQSNDLFIKDTIVADSKIMEFALSRLKELVDCCDSKGLKCNPIKVYEILSNNNDKEIYCPMAFSYSNYSREGYSDHPLTFGNVLKGPSGNQLRTTIGGAGIAISRKCRYVDAALDYARYVMSPSCQRTLYFDSGGQPGHRSAWLDKRTNQNSRNFFQNTLETMDNSYTRPRYNGHMYFQDKASMVVHEYLTEKVSIHDCIKAMNGIYVRSLVGASGH
jgi:multiple sugar transport system substrate-binding protein